MEKDEIEPKNVPQQIYAQARKRADAGDLDGAKKVAQGIVGRYPDFAPALHLLGRIAAQQGDVTEAIRQIKAALAVDKHLGPAQFDLGNLYRQRGDFATAVQCYRLALAADPAHDDARRNLALLLADTVDVADEQAAEALPMLIHIAEGESPVSHAVLSRLAVTFLHLNRPEDALHWLGGRPQAQSDGELLFLEGNARYAVGDFDGARHVYQLAIDAGFAAPALSSNLGNTLKMLGQLEAAVVAYRGALDMAPDLAGAWAGLGDALEELGQYVEAGEAYEAALRAMPDFTLARCALFNLNLKTAQWAEFDGQSAQIAAAVEQHVGVVSPFVFLMITNSPKAQYQCSKLWAETQFGALSPSFAHHRPRRPGPIRIGYLAGGFRRHPMAHLLSEVFERHDRDRFEIFGYSHGPDDGSDERRRLSDGVDVFRDVRSWSHGKTAQQIYDDEIDILIDRDGYTEGARTEVLAARPAPVQVNYLTFGATMGADFIDYIIVDPQVVPMAQAPHYSEAIVHLPDCYQPNNRARVVAPQVPLRGDCGLPEDGVVFCSFSGTYKITPSVFGRWMRILSKVHKSVLWLLGDDALTLERLRDAARRAGVNPKRLVFAPKVPNPQHLARQTNADLFLDTYPVNALTTTSDALWMGCPVITCVGETFISRGAASILAAVGLPELVTQTGDAYEALAVRLALNPTELAQIRATLAANRMSAPLFDTPRYVRHLEAAFATMHQRFVSGLPPEAFQVPVIDG